MHYYLDPANSVKYWFWLHVSNFVRDITGNRLQRTSRYFQNKSAVIVEYVIKF